jgi:hypothetical protein
MKHPFVAGLVIAAAHAAIVLSLGVQATVDQDRLPRAWAQAAAGAPQARVHGRYLTLNLVPVVDAGLAPRVDVIDKRTVMRRTPIVLEARDGRLLAHKAAASGVELARSGPSENAGLMIAPRVEYFLPPHAADPMPLLRSGELWVEVAVPRNGPPRPLRLGVMRNGIIGPLIKGAELTIAAERSRMGRATFERQASSIERRPSS